jgi:hypothetical protein
MPVNKFGLFLKDPNGICQNNKGYPIKIHKSGEGDSYWGVPGGKKVMPAN